MEALSQRILATCRELFKDCTLIDSAPRDVASYGIAQLLHVAYDCQACALGLQDEAFWAFVENSTAEWFRTRGFAEWYCQGAGNLFNMSRPRILSDMPANPKTTKRKGKK